MPTKLKRKTAPIEEKDDDVMIHDVHSSKHNPKTISIMPTNKKQKTAPIEEDNVMIHDDHFSKNHQNKMKSAMKHFDYFLKNHYVPKDRVYFEYTSHEDVPITAIDHHLTLSFIKYLKNDARVYQNPNKDLLSDCTIVGYFSTWKVWYLQHYKEAVVPIPFRREAWAIYIGLLHKVRGHVSICL